MTAVAQRSFAGGELSPSMYANTDQTKYATGLRQLRNMFVRSSGGVSNRPGTEFVGEVKSSSTTKRLIKYDNTDTFVIELGNLYARFYKNGARVTPVGALDWDGVTLYGEGSVVLRLGVYYYGLQSGTNKAPESQPAYWYPMTGTIFEIPTPYLTADLSSIDYAQSGSTITLVHPSYAPRELVKGSLDYVWILSTISFEPSITAPENPALAGGSAHAILYWAITAIAEETFEESLAALVSAINRLPSGGTPTTVTWDAVNSPVVAKFYNVYRSDDGVSYGLIGQTSSASFSDVGGTPDLLHTFPQARDIMNGANKYPSAVTYYQQRRVFADSNNDPETVWGSRIGEYSNFGITFPLQDDDAVTFKMAGKRSNPVKHLLDLGRLVVFTAREEKLVEGDQAGILKPDAVNPRKLSANGSGRLPPLELDTSAIYVQARGTKVRDLVPVSADAYQGTDLTVFASHLFEGFTLSDWDYAQNPNSIVWAARSDGVLLGLTYLREHAIWGWHHHDTDGTVENVCVVPEGSEDRVYLVVKRTINGSTKRYVERLASRFYTESEDAFFVDCGLSYDGWNAGATTVTLSGGTDWDEDELLTATASAGSFVAGDVDNQIFLPYMDDDGNDALLRLTIDSYTSATVVKGFVDKTVPASLQGVATTDWALAKKVLSGFSHLEGKSLSVLGDGYVAASPNNDAYDATPAIVTAGVITLNEPHAVVHAGLPFISDFEPLELDTPGTSTIKNSKLLVNKVGLYVERSRGIWIGEPDAPTEDEPLAGMQEWKARDDEDYGSPTDERTEAIEVAIESSWGSGRFLVRQVDPVPVSILSATPTGYLPT